MSSNSARVASRSRLSSGNSIQHLSLARLVALPARWSPLAHDPIELERQPDALIPVLRGRSAILSVPARPTAESAAGCCSGKAPFPIHPHMLRHSTGYKLANDGHDTRALQHYMGHKNIMHTVRYTEMAPDRFKDFWKD